MLRQLLLLICILVAADAVSAQSDLSGRLEDLRQETTVRVALAQNQGFRTFDVSVDAADGVVVLSGFVPTLGSRDRVVEFVSQLSGIRVVRSTLRLEGQPDSPLPEINPSDPPAEEPVISEENSAQNEQPEPPSTTDESTSYHTVQRGDTLYGIARRYGTTVRALAELNNLSTTTVRIGQRIRIR